MTDSSPKDKAKTSEQDFPYSLGDVKDKVSGVSVDKRWAMACYIPFINLFTCVLTSVKMINSKFCLFHARQGLVVFALWAISILIGVVFPTLGLMMWGVVLLLCVSGMVIAYTGKETEIPIIGQFAKKIPEYFVFKTLTGKIPEKDCQSQVSVHGQEKVDEEIAVIANESLDSSKEGSNFDKK